MYRLETNINPRSPDFKENHAFYQERLAEFRTRFDSAKAGGPEESRKRHTGRGKLLARDRLNLLFDKNTPFLEFSTLASNGMYDDSAPCAGIITGVGVVHGREVLIVVNDATVKGGTYFPITVLKHVRAQEIALENRLP